MFEHTQSKLYYGCRRCIHGDCYLKQERSRKQIRYNYPHNTFVFLFFSNFETMHGSFVQTVICSHICCCFFFKNMINTLYKKRILTNFLWPYRWHNQLESPNITWPQSLLMFAPTTSFLDLKIMNMNIGRRKFPLIPNKWNISSSQRMIK